MKNKRNFLTILIFILIITLNNYSFADEPTVYSPSAILIDSNSGNILYEKNSNSPMYPASTTKVLTAIIAIETCDLDDIAIASENAINSIKSGYTNAKIQVGEALTIKDLLYALLLNSANEAANVIAEYVGGTTENFANIMNEKALSLGCTNTHFVNANGIHNDNHYTTASDLANITRYCMKNETFRKIVSTLNYTLPSTEQYPSNDRVLKNSNSLLIEGHKFYYPYAIGVKTGFTTQAKNCLIASSQKDGLELISVVLHAETTDDGRGARYVDTINMLEYGNNNYKSYPIIEKDKVIKTITVPNASAETSKLDIVPKETLRLTLPINENAQKTNETISINDNISAPIQKGDILGKISYIVNGDTYSTDLVASSDVSIISPSDV